MNSKKDWHPADIIAALKKKGTTLSALSRKSGYAHSTPSNALFRPWTKGCRQRIVPILTAEQRDILNQIHQFVRKGSLLPTDKNYIQQRNTYDGQCQRAGLNKMHGLRHAYAKIRYETLTGWRASKAGELSLGALTLKQQIKNQWAR